MELSLIAEIFTTYRNELITDYKKGRIDLPTTNSRLEALNEIFKRLRDSDGKANKALDDYQHWLKTA